MKFRQVFNEGAFSSADVQLRQLFENKSVEICGYRVIKDRWKVVDGVPLREIIEAELVVKSPLNRECVEVENILPHR